MGRLEFSSCLALGQLCLLAASPPPALPFLRGTRAVWPPSSHQNMRVVSLPLTARPGSNSSPLISVRLGAARGREWCRVSPLKP